MALMSLTPQAGTAAPSAAQGAKAGFVAKVTSAPVAKKIKVHAGTEKTGRFVKILAYGHSGCGKTLVVAQLLRAGCRVIGLATDFGGDGWITVTNELKASGELGLLENFRNFSIPAFDTLRTFCQNPMDVLDTDIYAWDNDDKPCVFVWDGFSGFQQVQVMEKVGSIDPGTDKATEGRQEGLFLDQQGWGMVKSATLQLLGNFLTQHNRLTGKLWHKYVTALEDKPMEDKLLGGATLRKGPLIQGAARGIVPAAFDIILEMKAVAKPEGGQHYSYGCAGNDKIVAKNRGFSLLPEEPADFLKLWCEKIVPVLGGGAQYDAAAKIAEEGKG